jgi:CTP synthase (UTP-ammonia lyase)
MPCRLEITPLTLACMRILALGDRNPEYLTHRELDAAFLLMPDGVECSWTATDTSQARDLESADAVWLLPGTPYRDDAAAYAAVDYCRRSGTPFLGTCGGFQYACVELARTLAGITSAAHAETDPDADELIVVPLQCSLYGETRQVEPVPGTRLAAFCGDAPFAGFHWCGYGLSQRVEAHLQSAGIVISARAADAGVEAIELSDHPFFIATAFQPQIGAGESGALHPLISALVQACADGARVGQRAGR